MLTKVEADYLIVGAGASGMAFADILLEESDKTCIIVDKYHKPGGHWNDAYSFVTLHQPSSFYGVSSKELSKGLKDRVGLNKGLNELASGAEIQAYYDDLMRESFIPSGRVQYFPMCEYLGDGKIRNLLTGEEFTAHYHDKLIDSTYYQTSIPATHTLAFPVDPSMSVIPPNVLPSLNQAANTFTVLGGGKTAMDTCLWLLEKGVNPDAITWIMPRDGWLLDRKNTQPTQEFFFDSLGAQAAQLEAVASSTDLTDMFLKLEQAGVFIRLDKQVLPSMFHGATISMLELKTLQKIKNIVRLGRVTAITPTSIELDKGSISTCADTVHIDCTASAITNLAITDIFQQDTIRLQTVRAYQPVFSAAFIAHIELTYTDEEKKNKLCRVVPLPNHAEDWVELTYRNMMNQYFWSREPGLKKWLLNNRLDGFMRIVKGVAFYELNKLKILNRMRKASKPAIEKLKQYKKQLAGNPSSAN
jgi:hypothetical protein